MDVNGFRTLDELLAAGVAPTLLSAADTLEVMDGLQACESSWHGGFSLADTILSCLYVQCPERLEAMRSPVLRAFCNGVRASVGLVRALVIQADIYEEEDFVPHPFGAPLRRDLRRPRYCSALLRGGSSCERLTASGAGSSLLRLHVSLRAGGGRADTPGDCADARHTAARGGPCLEPPHPILNALTGLVSPPSFRRPRRSGSTLPPTATRICPASTRRPATR